jgi:hypothetical protein
MRTYLISAIHTRKAGASAVVLFLLFWPTTAAAHHGTPFPIIENQRVGGCTVSLWTHPHVGTVPFFVLVDPVPGGKIPDDLRIEIGVQPENGRLPEAVYPADRDETRRRLEYKALVQFDRDESWRVRLTVRSSQGSGELLARVDTVAPGYGRWDLLLYLLPFLAIAFLWFRRVMRRRSYKNRKLQAA